MKEIKIAMIGLDTSHSIEFPRYMVAMEEGAPEKIDSLKPVSCLRFDTPFQSPAGLDARQKQLEEWGIPVTLDFDEAVKDCDGIMLEINDTSFHLEYFKRAAELGKPIFLDKPMADTIANGLTIAKIAAEKKIPVFSTSSLRYIPEIVAACKDMPKPVTAHVWGCLGKAPAGSSIVWYGVHAFEMLATALGTGAATVTTTMDAHGALCVVQYRDGRRGMVELTHECYAYGGVLRDFEREVFFAKQPESSPYGQLMHEIENFFQTGITPVPLAETIEVMAMLDAADRSSKTGKAEVVYIA